MASSQLEIKAAPAEYPPFRPPGPGPLERDPPLYRQLLLSLRSSIEAWPRAVYEQRIYRPPVPGTPVLLMDPAAIRAVMVEHADDFPHGALWRRMLRPVWGDGLATVEGAEWRWQRRAAAPAFRAAQMTALTPRMRAAAEAALARWAAEPRAIFDIAEEMAQITFDIILDTILSGGEDLDRATARARVTAFLEQLAPMRLSYFLAPDSYHRGRDAAPSAEAKRLREDVDRMIRRRRRAPPRADLVDLLMSAADPETGRAMDDVTLRDNLLGFIVAGFATSAFGLAWSLYLVSSHAPTEARLRTEVDDVTGGGPVEPEHVDKLVFARQVVQESLRLYPPAHSTTRVAARTMKIEGVTIRRGSRVVLPIYALHRHRLWWRDPDLFDPDRFAPGESPPDRHIYMPFGAGPRTCLGAAFAMTELVVTLATLVRGVSFNLMPGHQVWPIAELALRPKGGLPMRVNVRAPAARRDLPLPSGERVG